ncbi:hypothetical protein B0H19DRAFT_435726 [Mycena capillaripes]|nr:hypothetical protein B0H19DRAFT_435726 [Mycena capillaripes]
MNSACYSMVYANFRTASTYEDFEGRLCLRSRVPRARARLVLSLLSLPATAHPRLTARLPPPTRNRVKVYTKTPARGAAGSGTGWGYGAPTVAATRCVHTVNYPLLRFLRMAIMDMGGRGCVCIWDAVEYGWELFSPVMPTPAHPHSRRHPAPHDAAAAQPRAGAVETERGWVFGALSLMRTGTDPTSSDNDAEDDGGNYISRARAGDGVCVPWDAGAGIEWVWE